MFNLKTIHGSLFAALCFFAFMTNASAKEKEGLVLQVSDNNPIAWNLALNVAENAPKNAGFPLNVTVIAFGPGLKMLLMDSTFTNRVKKAAAKGVEFRACGMTMKKLKLKDEDLYSNKRVKRVEGGVIEIMRLQKAGWAYVKI